MIQSRSGNDGDRTYDNQGATSWYHFGTTPGDIACQQKEGPAVAEGKEEPDTRYDCTRQNAFINE